MVAHHDGGVPWDAALANDFLRYPEDFRTEIETIAAWRPPGHHLYLAVTPIAFLRNRLAPTRGSGGAQIFQPPWDSYPFGDAARYPDGSRADPSLLPRDYFSAIAGLSPGKPFTVAETAWPVAVRNSNMRAIRSSEISVVLLR